MLLNVNCAQKSIPNPHAFFEPTSGALLSCRQSSHHSGHDCFQLTKADLHRSLQHERQLIDLSSNSVDTRREGWLIDNDVGADYVTVCSRRPPLASERSALHTVAVLAVVVVAVIAVAVVVVAVVAVIEGYDLLSFAPRCSGSFLVCSQSGYVGVCGCYVSFLLYRCGGRDRRDCTVVVTVVVPAAIESCSCTPFSSIGSASGRHGGSLG